MICATRRRLSLARARVARPTKHACLRSSLVVLAALRLMVPPRPFLRLLHGGGPCGPASMRVNARANVGTVAVHCASCAGSFWAVSVARRHGASGSGAGLSDVVFPSSQRSAQLACPSVAAQVEGVPPTASAASSRPASAAGEAFLPSGEDSWTPSPASDHWHSIGSGCVYVFSGFASWSGPHDACLVCGLPRGDL